MPTRRGSERPTRNQPLKKAITRMPASEHQITELASTIETQANAIAQGTVIGPRYAAVKRLQDNIETLAAWVRDDRK